MKPLMLDLFCGAGGAARGYAEAGFEVIGVDIRPQPNYPYPFMQTDALELLRRGGIWPKPQFVHASPPCQAHSRLQKQNGRSYPDHIAATRQLLWEMGLPYIIENVEGAPLMYPVLLCGSMFPTLRVYRHRLFESNLNLWTPTHPPHTVPVYTRDKRRKNYGQPMTPESFVQVNGGGNALDTDKRRAMGLSGTGMLGREINEAIPPAYTAHLGQQVREKL